MANPKQEIEDLSRQLRLHNKLYYEDSDPVITDAEYDRLFEKLRALEISHPEFASHDSPTQKLAVGPATGFAKVKHKTRMLSIGNTFSEDGVSDFAQKMRKFNGGREVEYSAEPKFDGLAVSLIYRDGKLVTAATRGDYEEGENVTANAMFIDSIPKSIDYKDELDVRGEVMMTTSSFAALNARQGALGEKEYSNPRNAASGSLRLLDPAETGRRGLVFTAYSITDPTLPPEIGKQNQVTEWLRATGFPVDGNMDVVVEQDGIQRYYDHIASIRQDLPFDIDGIVLKVNDLALQHEAGYISREPRAMLAYKFNQQQAYTTVIGIDVQIGRTGALTPVARLAPINLGGVVVENATLHNADEIRRLDVHIGDTVLVRRNGDVIPGILGVDTSKRTGNEIEFHMPGECPCCSSPVEKDKDEDAVVRCTGGLSCEEQAVQGLIYFVSRAGMQIEGAGESVCRNLYRAGMVKSPDQFYRLSIQQAQRLEGFGRKSAENLIDAIEASRTPTLRKFLVALGIRNAGEGTAKRLESALGSLDAIRSASYSQLVGIKDIGQVVGTSLYNYFRDPSNIDMLNKLDAVMDIKGPEEKVGLVDAIAGKTFVITGTLDGMSRDQARDWIESMGGITSGSVSKKTDYLLAGDDAGGKLDKAKSLGVQVLDLESLREIAGKSPCIPIVKMKA